MADPNPDEERRAAGEAFLAAIRQMRARQQARDAECHRLLDAALASETETKEESK